MKVWVGLVAVCVVRRGVLRPSSAGAEVGDRRNHFASMRASKQIKLKGDDGAAYTVTLSDTTSLLAHSSGREGSQEGQLKSHFPT